MNFSPSHSYPKPRVGATEYKASQIKKNRAKTAITAFSAAAVLAFTVIAVPSPVQAKQAPKSFADLVDKLLPAVVNISSTQMIKGRTGPEMPQFPPGSPFQDFFKQFFDHNSRNGEGRPHKATSLGSGFIIDTRTNGDSYVVTNNHVIDGADKITVILQDNSRLKATLVGRDVKTDLAVLKVTSKRKLPSVPFGDSTKSRVGDWVVAIGNPFGLGGTVTAGIISARGRDIHSGPYDNFIQTDASINRGNSGGPMFDVEGEVIGINSAIYSPSGGSVGIGFAIPSSGAKPIIAQLIKYGEVKRGWLGVHIQGVTSGIAETLGLDKPRGALVASVMDGGPAKKSGIKAGDIILKFNGRAVPEMRKLPRIVAETEINKPVSVTVWRDGKEKKLNVVVGKMDEAVTVASTNDNAQPKQRKADSMIDPLGVALAEISPALRKQFKLDKKARGVVVTEVKQESVAADKGVRPGDLIVEVSQVEVTTPGQVIKKIDMARKDGRKTVLFLIEGQSGLRFVALKIDKQK